MNEKALQPYLDGTIDAKTAIERGRGAAARRSC